MPDRDSFEIERSSYESILQVYLHEGKHRMAGQSLEQAVSHSFAVRNTLLYHIIHAKVLLQAQELDEAVKVLDSAMALPGVKGEVRALNIHTVALNIHTVALNVHSVAPRGRQGARLHHGATGGQGRGKTFQPARVTGEV